MKRIDASRQWHIPRVMWGGGAENEPWGLHYAGSGMCSFMTACGVVDDGQPQDVPMSDRRPVDCPGCTAVVRLVLTGREHE